VRQFEEKFAALIGTEHAIAVSSGTAALHTAIIYLNPDPGDEILVSPITDMGSVIPILYQQAIPVFIDIDPRTQNMDPDKIEEKITSRTRGIMVTHIFGNPADMGPIMEIAKRHDLFVIEDCAQAHLAEYRGRLVGGLGHIGCFSFQQSKHITTGDGGMVVSNEDKRFGRELRLCFDKGWPREKRRRDHYFLAPNYHMTELQAAIGIAQTEKLKIIVENRRKAAMALNSFLSDFDEVQTIRSLPGCIHSYFYVCFTLNLDALRVDSEVFEKALLDEGLECELGYPGPVPLYYYPMIKNKRTFGSSGWPFDSPATQKSWSYPEGLCPEAEKACRSTIVLPWNERLQSKHVELIAEAIHKVIRAYRV